MQGRIRVAQYGRDAVLEAKGEMSYREMLPVMCEREKAARELINEGWAHVLYGMKKYTQRGEVAGIDFMMVPMTEEQFEWIAKRCRNVLIYALHNNGGGKRGWKR